MPLILRVDAAGKISTLALDNAKHSSVSLVDAPESNPAVKQNPRMQTITNMNYINGNLIVAGLSNEEWSSALRSIPFPFENATKGATLQIWHSSHGRFETQSPVRTFVPYTISGQPYILAAYTCTPLVKIPVSQLQPGAQVKGVEIADLGAGNQPLDMVPYKKDGHDFILIANSARGVMKLKADHLESYPAIESPTVTDVAGVPYETMTDLKDVQHLTQLDGSNALIMTRPAQGDRLGRSQPADDRFALISWHFAETQVCVPCGHPLLWVMTASAQTVSIQFDGHTFKVSGWKALSTAPAKGWGSVFNVYAGAGDVPPLAGTYSVEGDALVFHPSYPIVSDVHYRAVFRAARGRSLPVEKIFDAPHQDKIPSVRVEHVYPSGDVLPSNLLRLYISFSGPMSRSESAHYLHVLDENGKDLQGDTCGVSSRRRTLGSQLPAAHNDVRSWANQARADVEHEDWAADRGRKALYTCHRPRLAGRTWRAARRRFPQIFSWRTSRQKSA